MHRYMVLRYAKASTFLFNTYTNHKTCTDTMLLTAKMLLGKTAVEGHFLFTTVELLHWSLAKNHHTMCI